MRHLACVQTLPFLPYFALVSIMQHWIMMHVYIQSLLLIARMVWVTWILNIYAEFDSDTFTSHHHLQLLVADSLCQNGGSEATDSHPSSSSFEKSLTKRQKRWILKLQNKQVQAPFLWNTNRAQVYPEHRFECWKYARCSLQYIQQGIYNISARLTEIEFSSIVLSFFCSPTSIIVCSYCKVKLDDDIRTMLYCVTAARPCEKGGDACCLA